METGSDVDEGRWLVEHRMEMDRGEARWLERLAEFDREQLWSLDGQFSCVTWLVWRTNMARSTAFEKLRVAHQLSRRSVVAEAFRDGRLSYSAARAITRMDNPDPEVDEALVALAESDGASILDVERAVRSYGLYVDQERPPPDDPQQHHRDVKIHRDGNGTSRIVITVGDVEIEEFASAFQAFLDLRYRRPNANESSREDSQGECEGQSSAEDWSEAPLEESSRPDEKANAFMDMVRTSLAHADDEHAAGDDRYLVHLVTHVGTGETTLLAGAAVHPAEASMIACDTSVVTHAVSREGEPLNLGRKAREWSTAQRRAINVRDGGCCRFVGCYFAHVDIHHMRPWESEGRTDIDNGFNACRRHHGMLHASYSVSGDPNGELRFYRADGTYIGSTYPATALQMSLASDLGS